MADANDQPRRQSGLSPWRLLILAALVAFAIAAGVAVWVTYRVTGPAVSVSITNEFREYIPTVGRTDGILETATSSVPETFTQTDSAWLFNIIPLGTTVSEIRVPAVYRYHIQLFDPWKLAGQRPGLPRPGPAIQAQPSAGDHHRANGEKHHQRLAPVQRRRRSRRTSNTASPPNSIKRANDKLHRDFVREACRQSVAGFVRTWLMKEDYWRDDRFHQIAVVFPDEVTSGAPQPLPPAITFESESRPSP